MGPGEMGHWFLADHDGNSFPFVTRHEDHPSAATLLGWSNQVGITDRDSLIDNALDFLMTHTGEDFEAPAHIADFFRQLNEDIDL